MPNIEIHGLEECQSFGVKDVLRKTLEGARYAKDVVITFVPDEVVNLEEESQPFLRIIVTKDERHDVLDSIKRRLADILTLDMDIEVFVAHEFISKKK